jgi:hypothetical protein
MRQAFALPFFYLLRGGSLTLNFPNGAILSEVVFQTERRISRGAARTLRAGSLAPLVKARGVGMTH